MYGLLRASHLSSLCERKDPLLQAESQLVLKQPPRCWSNRLNGFFTRDKAGHSLYFTRDSAGAIVVMLAVVVDDIHVACAKKLVREYGAFHAKSRRRTRLLREAGTLPSCLARRETALVIKPGAVSVQSSGEISKMRNQKHGWSRARTRESREPKARRPSPRSRDGSERALDPYRKYKGDGDGCSKGSR